GHVRLMLGGLRLGHFGSSLRALSRRGHECDSEKMGEASPADVVDTLASRGGESKSPPGDLQNVAARARTRQRTCRARARAVRYGRLCGTPGSILLEATALLVGALLQADF